MARELKPEYRLLLPSPVSPKRTGACVGLKLSRPAAADAPALAELMLDAYRGTIDDEGEDLEASAAEVARYLGAGTERPMLELSVVARRGSKPVGACLVAWIELRNCPFVAYVVTAAAEKRRGVGRLLVSESIRRAGKAGHKELRAFITKGNAPSEGLFAALGFERVFDPAPRS